MSNITGKDNTQYLGRGGLGKIVANAAGVLQLANKCGGVAELAAGTYTLPTLDSGQDGFWFLANATGSVTITGVGSMVTNDTMLVAVAAGGGWNGVVLNQASAAGGAAGILIADALAQTNTENVETALAEVLSRSTPQSNTTYNNTDGTGTLTAAAIVGGIITRTGETTAYTDTTATAAEIDAAYLGTDSGAWILVIKNTVAFTQTLAAGTDVILAGQTVTPANSAGVFLVTSSAAGEVTITGLGSMRQCSLPNGQYNTTAAASPVTPAAGILTGANHVFYEVTTDGAFGITTRSATQLFGDIPNCHIGYTYLLTIVNRGNATITITDGGSVTITASENTIATLVTRTYLVRFTSGTACTWTSLSKGTIET